MNAPLSASLNMVISITLSDVKLRRSPDGFCHMMLFDGKEHVNDKLTVATSSSSSWPVDKKTSFSPQLTLINPKCKKV